MQDSSTFTPGVGRENSESREPADTRVKWYREDPRRIEVLLNTNFETGLSEERVKQLQDRYGGNVIAEDYGPGFFGRLLRQFKSPLVLVLLIAGVAALALSATLDAIVIFIALAINVVVGIIQEERANRAFQKLNASQKHVATVIREGKRKQVSSEEIVAGDIVVLESGAQVPADIRILSERDLEVNEAPLTGEWVSVPKQTKTLSAGLSIADRTNMAWKGTLASTGSGVGVVVEVGEETELGKIAERLQEKDTVETPIQKNIAKLARFLTLVIVGAVLAIFVLGLVRGQPLAEMVLVAIAVAVSVVPEGLPAAVTVVLAVGMENILKRGGLVRNLLAAETLGSTTIILTDKTGTLTQARMKLASLITPDSFSGGNTESSEKELLKMAVLSSDAYVEEDPEEAGKLVVRGRPMEKAIVTSGLDEGISQHELFKDEESLDFLPFSSENRFAASLNRRHGRKTNRLYLSGAPEFLLRRAERVQKGGASSEMSGEDRTRLLSALEKETSKGGRVIALAYKDTKKESIPRDKRGEPSKDILRELTFAGMLVFEDPIREDVKEAMAKAKEAGARVVMLTGDNANTALSVARAVGIADGNTRAVLGDELETYNNDNDLLRLLQKEHVFARVLPEQKYRIATVLRNADKVVAMTGDGINDAPALRNADIGVATGSGTEVAKEASDLVLLDDSFSIIVSAIEEGRRIIDNLKKIVSHLVSTSFGEIFLIGGALAAGAALPILPAQILWVNIVEGGLLNFAFAFEPAGKGIMKRNPRSEEQKTLLTSEVKKLILTIGITTGLFTLALFFLLRSFGMGIDELRTIMFATLSFDAIFFILSLKDFRRPLWKIDPFSNTYLIFAVFVNIALLVAALSLPLLRTLLQLSPLNALDMAILIGVALFNLATIEGAKYLIFKRNRD